MSLQPGQTLNNRYRIVKLLGQGGFGAVYRAWDTSLDGAVALKECLATTPAAQKQFQMEAKILFQLRHPNLPRVTDYFAVSEWGDYLVMDYIEGEDLGARLGEAGRPLPVEDVVRFINQICDALIYLHAQNPPVIHRDIKPANIRIAKNGQAVLVDFGIAKLFAEGSETMTGARAITPGYSPPEQYGLGATDGRSDVYALGATVYNLLTGKQPPGSVDVLSGSLPPPPTLLKVNPAIPPGLSALIERAMRLNRAERLESAVEFKRLLLEACPQLTQGAATIPPVAPTGVAYQPVEKSQAAPVQPGVAVSTPGKPARSRNRRILWIILALAALCFLALVCRGVANGWREQQSAGQTQTVEAGSAGIAPDPTANLAPATGAGGETLLATPLPKLTPAAAGTREAAGMRPETVANLEEMVTFNIGAKPILTAFWPNAETLAAVTVEGIRLVRIADSARLLAIQNPSSAAIESAAFSSDNRVVACGFSDGKIRLWEILNSDLLATLNAHEQGVTSLLFNSGGDYLASGASDGSVDIWNMLDLISGKQPTLYRSTKIPDQAIGALAYASSLNALFIGVTDGGLYSWAFQADQLANNSAGKGSALVGLLMHGDSTADEGDRRKLAITYTDGGVYLWIAIDDRTIALKGNSGMVSGLAFSPDGSLLAGGDAKGRVLIWQTADGKLLRMLEGHSSAVISVGFSADGRQLVSAAEDGTILIWGPK